ncbi:MAG: FliI/YscN family ATPase [Armatimonadetes bacterium]|nr:FliI/YscN family ATPase [Armatimonadota bacterium]MDW8027474.1 FliI/YscN family ATPase [Armatimonadota bacterium]
MAEREARVEKVDENGNGKVNNHWFWQLKDRDGRLGKLEQLKARLNQCELTGIYGRLVQASGLVLESICPAAFIGELALVECEPSPLLAEVVGFRNGTTLLMPLGELTGLKVGAKVRLTHRTLQVFVSEKLIGRVLDGLGKPIDGKPLPEGEERPIYSDPPSPLHRPLISEPLSVGVRAIDAFLTLGKGQRVGIFAGSGVGKSTLLSMLARFAKADVSVIALIGERGREVREFLERQLGEEGLRKSVVVAATSDQPPIIRLKGALVAMTIAEFFRDRGADVLLVMDSLTRWAMAGREFGLAIGEPPTSRGYTPSVFAMMPRFLERAGQSEKGSITAIVTVLVEGDDLNDPIADHARSILDGHIVLSRAMTERGHLPPIDVLASLSRVMPDIVSDEHWESAQILRGLLSVLRDNEDLVRLGAYRRGTDALLDKALDLRDQIMAFLRQDKDEPSDFERTMEWLMALATKAKS